MTYLLCLPVSTYNRLVTDLGTGWLPLSHFSGHRASVQGHGLSSPITTKATWVLDSGMWVRLCRSLSVHISCVLFYFIKCHSKISFLLCYYVVYTYIFTSPTCSQHSFLKVLLLFLRKALCFLSLKKLALSSFPVDSLEEWCFLSSF